MNLTATLIRGHGASPGAHTGTVRVVRAADDARDIEPGDVVVAETALPRLVRSLRDAGALILDAGGALSSGATVAREFGIPAIVATGDASRVLRDGQIVAVDGAVGIVRLLDSERSPAA